VGAASASPTEVIALPRGGGVLCELGEKFSPDLFTGTGRVRIPVAVPAGRATAPIRSWR
jgi:hypothetical protein